MLTKHGMGQTGLRGILSLFGLIVGWGAGREQRFSGKRKVAMAIVGTTAVILLWGFGVDFVLHNYIFVSPTENSVQKMN